MYVARQVGIAGEADEVLSGRDLARLSEEEFQERAARAAVFARVTPTDKLRIVRALQAQGEVVAVFGDGVNDAPALKQADIGVVMGIRGTQVAKEAGDLILQDDRLGTIVSAVEGGRVIFRNLRLFVLYLLACNLSEVAVILVASLIRMPMPLKPLQILWVNLVTDVFPALALGREHHPGEVMREPARPRHEPFLGRPQYRFIFFYGSVMTVAVLAAYFFALKELPLTHTQATTVAFFSLSLAQLFFVPTVKASRGLRDRRALLSNGYVWLSILGCTLLVVTLPFIPVLRTALNVEDPGRAGWLLTLAASLVTGVVGLTVNTLKASRSPKA